MIAWWWIPVTIIGTLAAVGITGILMVLYASTHD